MFMWNCERMLNVALALEIQTEINWLNSEPAFSSNEWSEDYSFVGFERVELPNSQGFNCFNFFCNQMKPKREWNFLQENIESQFVAKRRLKEIK